LNSPADLACIKQTSKVLRIFDELQRQQDVSEPISNNAIYLVLLGRAQQEDVPHPDRLQIDQVLSLLSNPVLGLLSHEEDGYVLTVPPLAAKKRLASLADVLSTEE
jgi:septum formation inhibitor-activating ATPase MinD